MAKVLIVDEIWVVRLGMSKNGDVERALEIAKSSHPDAMAEESLRNLV